MEFLGDYLLFVAKGVTVVLVLAAVVTAIAGTRRRGRLESGRLVVRNLNRHYQRLADTLTAATLPRRDFRALIKRRKRSTPARQRRIFVLDFTGDMQASAVAALRQEITGIIAGAREGDEVLLRLESLGGIVAAYGLAAAQLERLKAAQLRVTVCVDRVAASGGYMMAVVADRLLAAPFAIVGSIGVIAQLPNFHRLLKKHDIDYEQFQAGTFKRTVSLFGENTDEGRMKLREQIEEVHGMFKAFVTRYRPELNIEQVATGEYWYGTQAVERGLVDELRTSDDYLLSASKDAEIYEVRYLLPPRRRLFRH